jgi:hypothetical protein
MIESQPESHGQATRRDQNWQVLILTEAARPEASRPTSDSEATVTHDIRRRERRRLERTLIQVIIIFYFRLGLRSRDRVMVVPRAGVG